MSQEPIIWTQIGNFSASVVALGIAIVPALLRRALNKKTSKAELILVAKGLAANAKGYTGIERQAAARAYFARQFGELRRSVDSVQLLPKPVAAAYTELVGQLDHAAHGIFTGRTPFDQATQEVLAVLKE